MKQSTKKTAIKAALLSTIALAGQQAVMAQEKVEVNGHDVGSWFENNWMWVAGVVVVLILLLLASGGGRSRRKTTTVVKDRFGDVKRVTTTEAED